MSGILEGLGAEIRRLTAELAEKDIEIAELLRLIKVSSDSESVLFDTTQRLRAELAELREALSVYADDSNWSNDDWGILSVFNDGKDGYGNPTKLAKDALRIPPSGKDTE